MKSPTTVASLAGHGHAIAHDQQLHSGVDGIGVVDVVPTHVLEPGVAVGAGGDRLADAPGYVALASGFSLY